MNTRGDWSPIFRVVESGSRGKRLHIHFLNVGKLKFDIVKNAWRALTQENSNVNFSKVTGSNTPVYYVMKYLTKSQAKYSFLGVLRRIKLEERENEVCNNHALPWQYDQLVAGSHQEELLDVLRGSDKV